MKQKFCVALISFIVAVSLSGCVHDYPAMTPDGEDGVDPTLVEVSTDVVLDLELVPLEIVTPVVVRSGGGRAESAYSRRFIIEAWHEGRAVSRQVNIVDDAGDDSTGMIRVPIRLKLHALEYTLLVWTDFVAADSTGDLFYDTGNLKRVSCNDPYTGSTDYRDCLYGTTVLDLRPYRDEWNASVEVKVDMARPLGKYELIATDVKDFLRKTKKLRDGNESFTITFYYGFYLPTVFNVLSGKPEDSQTGVQYTVPLEVPADGSEECTVGSDFVFVNGSESSVNLSMEIRDGSGNVLSRTKGLDIPFQRGHLTTVRARFLTNGMQGGVEIDDEFSGDVDVDLDGLLDF